MNGLAERKTNTAVEVFILEDSPLIRQRLIDMVSEMVSSKVIGQMETADGAAKSILELRPQVVMLDIALPGGNGLDVLKTVKQSLPATIVIVLTNYIEEEYRKACMESGADFFFNKSLEFNMVRVVLDGLAKVLDNNSGKS